MKYLILDNDSNSLYRFRKELMERLLHDGNEIYAVVPFEEFVDELQALGVQVLEQGMNRRGKNPFQELLLFWNYKRVIKRISPDKIITYTIKPGIYGGLLAQKMGIPYVANITGLGTAFQHEGLFRSFIVKLWKKALCCADCVFFENQGNAQAFLDYGIISGDKLHVLHGAGVNLSDFPFEKYPEESERIRFLFIGRVMREKGVDELLRAMEHLHLEYPNIMLDIVGQCEENYEAELQQWQKKGFVKYHGFQRDVKPYIKQAHVSVLPSYHEGMANVLLESAAMGRPLITSNIHGCMEAVLEGETGFLCEVKNVQSLVEQMERFIQLPYEQRRKMGQRSHEFVEEHFDKKKVVRETMDLLERGIEQGNQKNRR